MSTRHQPRDYHLALDTYNHLPLLEEQRTDVPLSVLETLASVFFRHGAHRHFRISLLHRHIITPPKAVMVHTQGPGEEDICGPQELGSCKVQPCLFYYIREHQEFWPVEFQAVEDPSRYSPPGTQFLSELSTVLVAIGMDSILGVSHTSCIDGPCTEYLLYDGLGTVSRRRLDRPSIGRQIITEWSVHDVDGKPTAFPEKDCIQTPSGVHVPVPKK